MIDIRKMRLERGMNQKTLASSCGISPQLLSMIENGSRGPSVKTAQRIARVLHFDWTEFFSADQRDAG